MVHMCIVCKLSSKHNKNLSFHKFPKNEEKKQVWANMLGVTPTTDWQYVCGNHFSSDSYAFSNARKILKPNAIPLINAIITQDLKDDTQKSTNVLVDHCYAATCLPIVYTSTSTNSEISKYIIVNNYTLNNSSPTKSFIDVENCDDLPGCSSACTSTLETSKSNIFPGNKRIWSSSRFGDLSVLDFETPQQVTRNFSLVKEIVNQLRNKNKNLFRQNKRLRAKVSSLNHTLTDLKKKSLTEITANNLEALGSDVLLNLIKNGLAGKKEPYSNEIKQFSTTLQRYSPKAYCYVRKTLGELLPHPRTLRRLKKNEYNFGTNPT